MAVDPKYGNSSGYFRDPTNDQDFSVSTPRIIPCELKDGKFVWPQVALSDGSALVKIVYKLFTEEEKDLYKQYRGRSSSGEPKVKPTKQEVQEQPERVEQNLEVIKFDSESVMSSSMLDVIEKCDTLIGVTQIAGLTYVLLCERSNLNKVYHIPRGLIQDNIFDSLRRL